MANRFFVFRLGNKVSLRVIIKNQKVTKNQSPKPTKQLRVNFFTKLMTNLKT
jgi:hypothetical protein